jgi:hypothetical protein
MFLHTLFLCVCEATRIIPTVYDPSVKWFVCLKILIRRTIWYKLSTSKEET